MKIVLVTDTHLSPHDETLRDNLRWVRNWIASTKPDLVIHLGDISANGVHDPAELRQARADFDGVASSIRFLPGNHDIGDHPPEPGKAPRDPLDLNRLKEYRQIFGADWWVIEAGHWLLVGLNALLLGTGLADEAAQWRWLEEVTSAHSGPLGVFLHKPLFLRGPEEVIAHERYVPRAARLRLLQILRFSDLRFVAAGHTHQARTMVCDGVEHVWVPSCAFIIPDSLQEPIGDKLVGITVLEIDNGTHRFTTVVPAGLMPFNLLDYHQIYPALAAKLPAKEIR